MEGLKVIQPGMQTTVQDMGRKGFQRYGMPVAGAMDPFALQVGNLLTGNPRGEAGLEIPYPGFEGEFLQDTVLAVTGGDLGAAINGEPIPMWKCIFAKKGSIIHFKSVREGCRCYLTVGGGIDVPVVMGSKSTYLRGKIGGYKGRKLERGDILHFGSAKTPLEDYIGKRLPLKDTPQYVSPCKIRVILGPQQEAFTSDSIHRFLNGLYRISSASDRMGYRLEGPKLQHVEGADIISDGIPAGAVQVPGHGQPIIMLSDRQTTGGYTKIAVVISVDLSKLAQLKPGDEITFAQIDIEQAQQLLKTEEELLNLLERLPPVIREYHYRIKIGRHAYAVSVEDWSVDEKFK